MYNKNAAYDFKALEQKKPKRAKVLRLPGSKSRYKEKVRAQTTLITSVFSLFLAGALGFSGFVLGQARLTEVTDKSYAAEKSLEEYKSINTQLAMKLEALQSSDNFCGFGSKNDATVEIVKIHKGDIAKIN